MSQYDHSPGAAVRGQGSGPNVGGRRLEEVSSAVVTNAFSHRRRWRSQRVMGVTWSSAQPRTWGSSLAGMTEAWTDHALKALRVVCHTANGPSLLALLRTHDHAGVLQQCGDALTAAVSRAVPGAQETATACATTLRERGWPGDEILGRQLDTAGGGAGRVLRSLPVDLEELSGLLEGDPAWGGGRIDLGTGECRPAVADTDESGDEDEPEGTERWLHVPCEGSRDAYRDMEDFITTVDDQDLARYLGIAIQGPGAFRRFKDMLATSPAQLQRYWLFSAERQHGRARAWLADQGYRPALPTSH